MKILIKNGHLWTGEANFVADIFIEGGKIRAIGEDLSKAYSADETLEAKGLYVFPGGIDPHTHMELPFMGTYSSDDFETGTLAALFGGTTSIIDFAIQKKGDPIKNCVKDWRERADKKVVADYALHVAVTDYNDKTRKEIPELINDGIPSFKAFMAYKNVLMIDDRQLLDLLETAKGYGGLISVHAENGDLVDHLIQKFRSEGKLTPHYHPLAHAAEAEEEAAGRAMDLENYVGTDIYIVHTTYKGVLDRALEKMHRGQRVYIETCPQYLCLDDSCYDEPNFGGAKYVMSPPIRKKADQEALWAGIKAGYVQTVGTDHCPFNMKDQKVMGKDDFSKIPNGGPAVENRIELCFSEGVAKGRISMDRFVQVCSVNPARIFGMPNKGTLAVGADADIVIFDPNEKHVMSAKTHHMRCDYNMYEGWNITGRVKTVLSNGRVAIRDGKVDQVEKGAGRFIKRKPRSKI